MVTIKKKIPEIMR